MGLHVRYISNYPSVTLTRFLWQGGRKASSKSLNDFKQDMHTSPGALPYDPTTCVTCPPGALPHDPTTCVTCPPGLSPREVPTIPEATRSNKKQQEATRSNKKQQEATRNNKNQQEASRSSKKQEEATRSIKKQQEATRSMLMFSRRIWKVFCIAGPVIYGNRGRY